MPGRILVIRGGAIGDFILTLPAIRLLRENFPDCHLEILGYRHIASLAERRFYADATRSIEYAPLATFFNPKGDLDPELCTYFASFNQVISYIYDPDELFQTCLLRAGVKNLIAGSPKVGEGEHAAVQLAQPLDKLALWLEDPAARFFPSDEDQAEADAILAGLPGPYVAIHPGSGGEKKNWPLDRWVTVIDELLSGRHLGQVLIVGGEADAERLSSLHRFQAHPRCTFLQSLPLPVLGAVFSKCGLFVGHDSGISHLAAASGARCLLLFGPTDPDVWAPANDGVEVLWAEDGQLSELEVEAVLGKLGEILPDVL